MSLAFIAFCLWLPVALASHLLPAVWRGRGRLALLGLGGLIALLALVTGGMLPGAFALVGVLAVFPEPLALMADRVKAAYRARRAARFAPLDADTRPAAPASAPFQA